MKLLDAFGYVGGINECITFFNWARSKISSRGTQPNGTHEQNLPEYVLLQLQSDLQCLMDTLPAMYNLIDRAEWRSHERFVADLLSKLKDSVYDAEDLLDEFAWHGLKVSVEGNATSVQPATEFLKRVTQGSYNKVNDILRRLNNLSSQLEKLGLHQVTPRFDKSLRPETTSFSTESKIYGRDGELNELIRLLGVPANSETAPSRRKRTRRGVAASTSNQVCATVDNDKARLTSVSVLPIVGIGGVGKTTLAQNICNHSQVKSHFDLIIWTCVSDDFDIKRLTKHAIEQTTGRETTMDNLNSLQLSLATSVNERRLLIVLDDMWDDALKENGQCWKRFCAPFENVLHGSVIIITTRSQIVADQVCTMDPFPLDGLKDDVFWDFFTMCIFGYECSNIEPELEHIVRRMLPKLRGSPLAAKTIGHLLASLDTSHWEGILKSELWELPQKNTEILPALRLSYIYLPFHLKRCFSFCAVYPKDHEFEKNSLAEIWVAEGFVEPQGDIPQQATGCQYFDELVNRSFFQIVNSKYVIHDLMHDMAQLVSKDECFIIKNTSDFQKVQENVRHLSILPNRDIGFSNLSSLCKHSKLRTLLCHKSFMSGKASETVMDSWCSELGRMRVIIIETTRVLPDSISNMKHLRYLKISKKCPLKRLPSTLSCLYNLQVLYARKCTFETLPTDFNKLINLRRFESVGLRCPFEHEIEVSASGQEGHGKQVTLINNFNQFSRVTICGLDEVSKDQAAEANLKEKENLDSLSLKWSPRASPDHQESELLDALCPPTNIKTLKLWNYLGEHFPSWFHPRHLPNLTSLSFAGLNGLKTPQVLLDGMPVVLDDNSGDTFSCLTDLTIEGCEKLLGLEEILKPAYVPAIKKITITGCKSLGSLSIGENFRCLEELSVSGCPNISSPHMLLPSLKKLTLLGEFGNLADNIECCSLTYLCFSPNCESPDVCLPAVQKVNIYGGTRNIRPFSSLAELKVYRCDKLVSLDGILRNECLPSIKTIIIDYCKNLRSVPGESFGSFTSLRTLHIDWCARLSWRRGMVLPSSLQRLMLRHCGDISGSFPSFLENVTSLKSLGLCLCRRIISIPGHLWGTNLASLQELYISACMDLVSVGGPEVIGNIKKVLIEDCGKLTEPKKQPVTRGKLAGQSHDDFRRSFWMEEKNHPVQAYETEITGITG